MRPWTGSWRWIMLILFAWGTLLFYIGGHLVRDSEHPDHSSRELSKILAKLERLKQQNEDLRRMAESLRIPDGPIDQGPAAGKVHALEEQLLKAKEQIENYKKRTGNGGLGKDHEILRRRIENGAKELWFFLQSELKKLKNLEGSELQRRIDEFLSDLGHQERYLYYYLGEETNTHLATTPFQVVVESNEVSPQPPLLQTKQPQFPQPLLIRLVLQTLHQLHCPSLDTFQHLNVLLVVRGPKLNTVFEVRPHQCQVQGHDHFPAPAGHTMNYLTYPSMCFKTGEANDKDVQVVELPIVDSLHPRPPYLPLAIPEDLADRLIRVHGDPAVWWVSQFVKYLIRPQPWLEKEIEEATRKLGFKHPVIGVHVRRTDKVGTEAAFHPIEEYMVHVEERFELLARRMHVDKKRVYLATDDPSLLQEAKSKYPNYEFISDNSISWSAGLHNRYTENSLRGVILDIHFLSQADFLVCTFSSQVCRVAYEIMQTLHPDASAYFHSLDDIYYFGGQNAHNQIAIYAHHPRTADEIPMEPGDIIGVAGNHWDGYSKGINRKLGRTGLYPSYKVKEKIETVKYPTYPEADK
ncbi:FUT8 fucosyltransferase, partial [Pygoscelis papua]